MEGSRQQLLGGHGQRRMSGCHWNRVAVGRGTRGDLPFRVMLCSTQERKGYLFCGTVASTAPPHLWLRADRWREMCNEMQEVLEEQRDRGGKPGQTAGRSQAAPAGRRGTEWRGCQLQRKAGVGLSAWSLPTTPGGHAVFIHPRMDTGGILPQGSEGRCKVGTRAVEQTQGSGPCRPHWTVRDLPETERRC